MNPLIVIGVIVGAPVALIVLSRTKAALVFMALCVGSVLSTFVGDSALDMIQLFTRSYGATVSSSVQIGLLVAPALLTILFLGKTIRGSKALLNIFPAFLTGVMTLYLVTPNLPKSVRLAILATDIWRDLSQYQAIIVSTVVLLSLSQLWASGAAGRSRHLKKSKSH
ncbi:hypothetical protein KDA11_03290 [Candidatus Saccharibacteria bacterium]|nr:hypothetical protein [Candidatus Saccharibacteria bacterium]